MQRIISRLPYILCYIVAFVFGMKQLREPDVWWQLLTGRWMVENGAITRTDMFSFTMAGQPWVNVKWLYEIIIALLEKALGPEGVLLLQALVNVGILWALFHTLKHMHARLQQPASKLVTILGALFFFVVVEYRMTGRPEMVSHLMCALFISYLWCYPELKWKHMIWPVVLQCVWANMHEGYPIGIVILGSYVAGSFLSYFITKDKAQLQTATRSVALLGLAIVAIALNPNGIQLWKQPFEIYRQVGANKFTTELYSYTDPQYWTLQAKMNVAMMIVVIGFWIVRLVEAVKQKDHRFYSPVMLGYLLLIPLFSYLSLTANRNIPFAEIVYFPALPFAASWLVGKLKLRDKPFYITLSKSAGLIGGIVAVVLYVTIVNDSYYKATKSPNKYGIHTNLLHIPAGAANFLKEHNISGPAFSDYFVSSHMLWAMYPDFKSYIDLRDLDVFSEKFFNEYFDIYKNPAKFHKIDSTYNFNYVVLSTSQLLGLQKTLYWGEGYNMVYADPVSVIYLKIKPENEPINNNLKIQKLFNWPVAPEEPTWAGMLNTLFNPRVMYESEEETNAPIHAANFYSEMGNYTVAIKQLAPAMYTLHENADANYALGSTYLRYATTLEDPAARQQKIDSANYLLTRAIELNPKKENAYSALASVHFFTGNYVEAEKKLQEYISMKSDNDFVYFMLGLCYKSMYKTQQLPAYLDKMLEAMQEATAINPDNGQAYLYTAEAHMLKGDKKAAATALKMAVSTGMYWRQEEQELLNNLKAQTGVR